MRLVPVTAPSVRHVVRIARPSPSPAGRAFSCLIRLSGDLAFAVTVRHTEARMPRLDWLSTVWFVSTMFLAALLGYVLLHTM